MAAAVVVVGEQHLSGAVRNAQRHRRRKRAGGANWVSLLAHRRPTAVFFSPLMCVCVCPRNAVWCAAAVCGVSVLSAMANPFISAVATRPNAWAVFLRSRCLELPIAAARRLAGMQCAWFRERMAQLWLRRAHTHTTRTGGTLVADEPRPRFIFFFSRGPHRFL